MPKHLGRNRNKYIANKRAKAIKEKVARKSQFTRMD